MFLENFSFVILKSIIAGKALIDKKEEPGDSCVNNEEVGKDGRYVSVPSCVEIGVKRKCGEFEEIFNICRNCCEKGYIVAWSETKDVSIDKNRHKDCVEYQK